MVQKRKTQESTGTTPHPFTGQQPALRHLPKHLLRVRRVCLALMALMLMSGALFYTTRSQAVARFGTRCQRDYQHGWQHTLDYMWNRCDGFNNELDDTDTKVFYFNLTGPAESRYSTCDSCGTGVDDVHLAYTGTHGGGWSNDAVLAMWTDGVLAESNNDSWRFGDESTRCAFFAQYACETLKLDGTQISRWRNTFRGGLIMAMGSHDKLYDGLTTDETGEDFADGLQKGKTVKWAWFDGNGDWWCDQDVAVLATGSNQTDAHNAQLDCNYRRDNVKWQNFGGYARWRDSQIGWWCWAWITDN